MSNWLSHRNASNTDLRKLWQGLFFCNPPPPSFHLLSFDVLGLGLWHADKLLIQAEVATNLAGLVHAAGTVEGGMRFFDAGLWTTQQQWPTIDKYRIDKFLSLLRHLLRQALLLLAHRLWRAEDVALFVASMKAHPFGWRDSPDPATALPPSPGVALHFADIFLDELTLVPSSFIVVVFVVVAVFCVPTLPFNCLTRTALSGAGDRGRW